MPRHLLPQSSLEDEPPPPVDPGPGSVQDELFVQMVQHNHAARRAARRRRWAWGVAMAVGAVALVAIGAWLGGRTQEWLTGDRAASTDLARALLRRIDALETRLQAAEARLDQTTAATHRPPARVEPVPPPSPPRASPPRVPARVATPAPYRPVGRVEPRSAPAPPPPQRRPVELPPRPPSAGDPLAADTPPPAAVQTVEESAPPPARAPAPLPRPSAAVHQPPAVHAASAGEPPSLAAKARDDWRMIGRELKSIGSRIGDAFDTVKEKLTR